LGNKRNEELWNPWSHDAYDKTLEYSIIDQQCAEQYVRKGDDIPKLSIAFNAVPKDLVYVRGEYQINVARDYLFF